MVALKSALLDLIEVEFDWCRPTKDRHCHVQSVFLVIHFFDNAVEVVERSIYDANDFSRFEDSLRCRLFAALGNPIQNCLRFSSGVSTVLMVRPIVVLSA